MATGGFIHMDTDGVGAAMVALGETGRVLDAGWQRGRSAIGAQEAGIGSGPLGAAFRGVYEAERTGVRDIASRMPAAIQADATVGTQCVQDYRTADQGAAAGFDRLPG